MRRFLTFALTFFLAGCANISALLSTPEPVTPPQGTPVSTNTPVAIATSTPTATATAAAGRPRTLRIWVSPQFDPSTETRASAIFQARLDEFVARRPGLQIEVRVKAESMLNALTKTQAAAPSIMPDLVALSRVDMEIIAGKGLLHPLDGLTTLTDTPDWYPYAQQMAHIQNTAFGLPFAGDALTLIGYGDPLPTSWNELPEETLFIFPPADPQALFNLSLYLSAGGTLLNDQGVLTVDEAILADVLSLYLPSTETNFLSPISVDYVSDEQTWDALLEQRGNLAVSWVSNYLQNQPPALTIAPLPGREAGPYTLASGWSWALAGSNADNQPLAVELAEFLSESSFLAEWTQAAGYLPTRPTALSSWEDAKYKLALSQAVESAHLIPSQELLNTFGPLFSEAAISVISGAKLPSEAAQSVSGQLK